MADRAISAGVVGAIPWSAVDRYASRWGIDKLGFERLWIVLRAMDGSYLDWQRIEAKRGQSEG